MQDGGVGMAGVGGGDGAGVGWCFHYCWGQSQWCASAGFQGGIESMLYW